MDFEIVKGILIVYMICVAIIMGYYYFLNLKKTGEKSFWKKMGWWSLASVVVACFAGSGMVSPNTKANIACGCFSLIFLVVNGLYVGLGKD